MSAGLALLRNIDRIDGVTLGEWRGLGVAWLWTTAALALGLWLIGRRDA